jgi:ABC-type branched-subunit amino acid transport system substrate-binding protein
MDPHRNSPARWAIGLIALALLAAACAPSFRREAAPASPAAAAAEQLFRRAELRFAENAFPEALALYQTYLSRYPQEPDAPAALLKIAAIQARQGDAALARRTLARLIEDYPLSPLRGEAAAETLDLLFRQRRYAEVLDRGPQALALAAFPEQRRRILAVIADSASALERRVAAVSAAMQALMLADASRREAAAAKLKQALLRLNPAEVRELIERPPGDLPMDYLLFQAGMLLAQEGRFSDAIALLSAFRQRFPRHELSGRVEQILADIDHSARTERHIFGCLLPLTGDYQAIGQRVLRGIELALHRHNGREGAPPVQLVVKDTASEAERTARAFEELAREGASAVIGPLVHAEAAAREAERLRIPMIAITQREGVVGGGAGGHVFRNFITPRAQVRALAAAATQRLGCQRAAVLFPDENYGHTFAELFREEFEAAGGEILFAASYGPETSDFSALVRRLQRFAQPIAREGGPAPRGSEAGRRRRAEEARTEWSFESQAVFIPDEPKKVGMLASQMAYHDLRDVTLLGTNLWHSEALFRHAQPYVEGAVFADAFFAGSSEPEVREFVEAFRESYQETPGFMEAIVYDTTMILLQTISRPDVRGPGDIAPALRSSPGFTGVTGFTRFEASGEVDKRLRLLQVRGRRLVELD